MRQLTSCQSAQKKLTKNKTYSNPATHQVAHRVIKRRYLESYIDTAPFQVTYHIVARRYLQNYITTARHQIPPPLKAHFCVYKMTSGHKLFMKKP